MSQETKIQDLYLKHNLTKTHDVDTNPCRTQWHSTNCCASILLL